MKSGLWGPALILARASGADAYAETAAAMAAATAGPGSPLASVLLMLAALHDLVLSAKPVGPSSPAKAAPGSSFNLKGLLNKSASKVSLDKQPGRFTRPHRCMSRTVMTCCDIWLYISDCGVNCTCAVRPIRPTQGSLPDRANLGIFLTAHQESAVGRLISCRKLAAERVKCWQADVAEVAPLDAPESSAAEVAMLADWRSNLAALASFMASPADEALIVRLGDRLWEQHGQVRSLASPAPSKRLRRLSPVITRLKGQYLHVSASDSAPIMKGMRSQDTCVVL